jgi:hypothetical protein
MSEENETPKEDVKIEEPVVEEPTINPIDEAKNVLEETKKTLASISEERKRIEKATAEMLVNGRSYAGQAPPKEETADEKWAREAKLRYAGTGMDPTI